MKNTSYRMSLELMYCITCCKQLVNIFWKNTAIRDRSMLLCEMFLFLVRLLLILDHSENLLALLTS